MSIPINRRHLLGTGAAFGAAALIPVSLPVSLRAQGKTLVAATFPGTWNEAHREFLAPAFTKRTGASVTQSILLGNDQLSRLMAAKGGKPPFDVALFDSPQVLDAAKQGLIVEYPAAKSPNYKDLLPEFQDKWGPRITMQIVGIGYNPQKIKTPPKSWDVLWDPQYKGRVGLTALNSQLGIAFLAEINRLRGGNEENFEPAFKALREMLPNVGAIGANLGAYATLWQQEQIDIAPYNFNFVQTLKGKDVPVADHHERFIRIGHGRGRLVHQHARCRQCCRARPCRRVHRYASRSGCAERDGEAGIRCHPDQQQSSARGRNHRDRPDACGACKDPLLRLGKAQPAAQRPDRTVQPRDQAVT